MVRTSPFESELPGVLTGTLKIMGGGDERIVINCPTDDRVTGKLEV